MDSYNSGSLQSSSGGGEEEYDSRAVADSVSAFITSSPIPNPPPAPAPALFFDPLSNFVHSQFQNLNTALPGPASLRSDPNSSMLPSFMSSSFQAPPPVVADQAGSALPPPPVQNQNQTRNPRKRSRASRRAPTTVLTTDTSNFRAMVQEFTGIPSPPFSSSFPRARLDLFGTRSASMNGDGSSFQPPPYLRRPFPQKIQTPPPLPFLGSSSSPFECSAAAVNGNNINSVSSSTDSVTFQLPITNTTPFDLNRSTLFTSPLKTNPKFPFSDPPLMPAKSLGVSPQLILSTDEQFNIVHGNQVPSSLNDLLHSDPSPNADNSNQRSENGGGVGGFNFTMNDFSPGSSTSNFHGGEKVPENNSTAPTGRGEGMVESWICSSE